MKRIIIACCLFLVIAGAAAAQQASGGAAAPPEQGLTIIPGGGRVAILGRITKEGITGFRIYRKKDGGEAELVGELPAWKRDPDILIQEIGPEEFAKIGEKYDAKTPAELMHNASTNPGIYFSIMAIVPRYPRLIGLYEKSYIFIDEGLEPGVDYEYEVKEVAGGAEKPFELTGAPKIKGGEKISPAVPMNLEAQQGDGQATFAWDYIPGEELGTSAAGFFVYRKSSDESDFKAIGYSIPGRSEKVSFTDLDIQNGVEYSYYITSVNIVGFESEPSETVKIITADMTPPDAPENLAASFDNDNKVVKLKWDPAADEDFSYFNVYRTDNISEGVFAKVNNENVSSNEYSDPEVPFDGKTYFYTVTAIDKTGNESQKTTARTVTVPDMTPPAPPVNVKAGFDREKKSVKLTWEHGPADDVSVYAIFRGPAEDSLVLIKTIGSENLEFIDEIIREGETYFYAVNSQDRLSNISVPEKVIEVKIPDMTPPPTPYNLQAVLDSESVKIKVTWNDVKSADFKEYVVYRALEKEGEKAAGYEKAGVADKPEFIDESAEKGVLYWYRASQVDTSDNESNLCKPDDAKVRDSESPAVPEELKAEFKKDGIAVSWKVNAEEDLAGYNVYLVDLFRFTETKVTEKPVVEAAFVVEYKEVGEEGNIGVKVSAVDTSDNESEKTALVKPE